MKYEGDLQGQTGEKTWQCLATHFWGVSVKELDFKENYPIF